MPRTSRRGQRATARRSGRRAARPLAALLDRLAARRRCSRRGGHPLGRPLHPRAPSPRCCAAARQRLLVVRTYRRDELHRQPSPRPFLAEEETSRAVVERLELGLLPDELADQVAGIPATPRPACSPRLHARLRRATPSSPRTCSRPPTPPPDRCLRACATSSTLRLDALPDDARGVPARGRRGRPGALEPIAAGRVAGSAGAPPRRQACAWPGEDAPVQDADGYAFRHALLQEAALRRSSSGQRPALHLTLAQALRDDPTLADAPRRPSSRSRRRAQGCPRRSPPTCAPAGGRAGLRLRGGRAATSSARSRSGTSSTTPPSARSSSWWALSPTPRTTRTSPASTTARSRLVAWPSSSPTLRRRGQLGVARERLGRYLWIAGDSDGSLAAYRDTVRILRPIRRRPRRPRARGRGADPDAPRARRADVRGCERAIESPVRWAPACPRARSEQPGRDALGGRRLRRGRARPARAKSIAEEVSDHDGIWRAYTNLSECLDEQGRLEEAGALARGRGNRRSPGNADLRALPAGRGVLAAYVPGRLDETAAIVERVLAEGPKGVAAVVLHDNAAHLAMRRGRLDRVAEHFELARELLAARATRCGSATRPPAGPRRAVGRRARARVADRHRRAGLRPRGPVRALHDAAHATALRSAADRAQRAHALGDDPGPPRRGPTPGDLRQPARAAGPRAWHDGAPGPSRPPSTPGVAELLRAEGHPEPGAGRRRRVLRALNGAVELGHAALAPGRGAYRRRPGRGRRRPARGRRSRRRPGRPPLAAEVESLARRARVAGRGARRRRRGPDVDCLGLNERELTVLSLVAEGDTNREIGESLFISEKTASVHVSRILAKLGVCSAWRRRRSRSAWGWPRRQRQATAGAGSSRAARHRSSAWRSAGRRRRAAR